MNNFRGLNRSLWLLVFSVGLLWIETAQAEKANFLEQQAATQAILQQQRQAALQTDLVPEPNVVLPNPAEAKVIQWPTHEIPCFPIHKIILTGERANHFQFALDSIINGNNPAVGRCLGAQGINQILMHAQNAIINKGYVTTRVLFGSQNLRNGIVVLTVIPGLVNEVEVTPSNRLPTLQNALPIRAGKLLNLRDIEQGLENFKRMPSVEADIQISSAKNANTKIASSDLILKYHEDFPLRLNFYADDSGSPQTGRYQGSFTMSLDHPFFLNDLFYITLNHDLGGNGSGDYGTNGYTFFYSIPYDYWLLSASANQSNYVETVAGINQSYQYSGDNNNSNATLSRVVFRNADRKISLSLGTGLQDYRNFINNTEILVQHRRMSAWQASIAWREFIKNTVLDINLSYQHGTGSFGAIPAPESDFQEGSSRPAIVTGQITFNDPFQLGRQRWRYNGQVSAQWSPDTLIPQQRFGIGGRYTVRGFDGNNILSAENGWYLRNDIGPMLGSSNQQLYFGLDYGQVGGPSAEWLVGNQLAGTVIGLRGSKKGFTYDVFVGWPIYKPKNFVTASTTMGFMVSWTL